MKHDSFDLKRQNQGFAAFAGDSNRFHQADPGKCYLLQGRLGKEISGK